MQDQESNPTNQLNPDQDLKLKAFLINNKDIVDMWMRDHAPYTIDPVTKEPKIGQCTVPPPIYWDASKQEFFWLNRAARRAK